MGAVWGEIEKMEAGYAAQLLKTQRERDRVQPEDLKSKSSQATRELLHL